MESMRHTSTDHIPEFDAVVVGSGVAGLSAAATLDGLRTAVVSPNPGGADSSSSRATGGIAAAIDEGDSPELHARDTLEAGDGLCDPDQVDQLVRAAPGVVSRLERLGVAFDRDGEGNLDLGREAAHSRRRVVRAGRDQGGVALVDALYAAAVEGEPGVETIQGDAVDICRTDGRVEGLLYRDRDGELHGIAAPAVVLATGGIGGLYRRTTNPGAVTGRGLALGYRVGATLTDLEFVQFHPTALDIEGSSLPLLSEILRGEGARLVDADGRELLDDWEGETGDLAPRDLVARSVWRRREQGEGVYLDIAPVEDFEERFPGAAAAAERVAERPGPGRLPVTPAAHYHMGGISADLDGRTDVPGLWACGEVADTRVHGANRLASNSMLECLVAGGRTGESVAGSEFVGRTPDEAAVRDWMDQRSGSTPLARRGTRVYVPTTLRGQMWEAVGVVRDRSELAEAQRMFRRIRREVFKESRARDAALVAELIARSARRREESRGAHYRADFPESRSGWRGRIRVRCPRAPNGRPGTERPGSADWEFEPVESEEP